MQQLHTASTSSAGAISLATVPGGIPCVQLTGTKRDDAAAMIMAAPALLAALRKIANLDEIDATKYIKEVDDIACETLARLGFDL